MISARDVHALGRSIRRAAYDALYYGCRHPRAIGTIAVSGLVGMAWGRHSLRSRLGP